MNPTEALINECFDILGNSVPERTSECMTDYIGAITLLDSRENLDPRLEIFKHRFRDLYIYPERVSHNECLKDLHQLREDVVEEEEQENLKQELGGFQEEEEK